MCHVLKCVMARSVLVTDQRFSRIWCPLQCRGPVLPSVGFAESKRTLVQTLRLCTSLMAHRGSRGITLLFLDHGTRRGWGVSVTPRSPFIPGKDPVPIVQEADWSPGPVWTVAENLALPEIRSPDHPARSQSLYPLRYPAYGFAEGSAKRTAVATTLLSALSHKTLMFLFISLRHSDRIPLLSSLSKACTQAEIVQG